MSNADFRMSNEWGDGDDVGPPSHSAFGNRPAFALRATADLRFAPTFGILDGPIKALVHWLHPLRSMLWWLVPVA